MKVFFEKLLEVLLAFREEMGAIIGSNLYIFELVSLFISGLVLWALVYAVVRSEWLTRRVEEFLDLLMAGNVGKWRQLRIWKQIVKRMHTQDMNNWKLAIVEADRVLDDIFKAAGYFGESVDIRFQQIKPEILSNIEEAREAHKIRNRVVNEADFTINRDEAVKTIRVYQKSFRELGLIE